MWESWTDKHIIKKPKRRELEAIPFIEEENDLKKIEPKPLVKKVRKSRKQIVGR